MIIRMCVDCQEVAACSTQSFLVPPSRRGALAEDLDDCCSLRCEHFSRYPGNAVSGPAPLPIRDICKWGQRRISIKHVELFDCVSDSPNRWVVCSLFVVDCDSPAWPKPQSRISGKASVWANSNGEDNKIGINHSTVVQRRGTDFNLRHRVPQFDCHPVAAQFAFQRLGHLWI